MPLTRFTRALSLAVTLAAASIASAITPLKNGDRIVFFGDSITEQKLYTRYLQTYITARYPELDLRFFNAGWGGDVAPRALGRLERDVLVLKPTVVTLFFGMNDGHYTTLNDETVKTYRDNMEAIVKKLQENNVRVILYAPGAVDYDKNAKLKDVNYNATLKALGDVCRELAKQYDCETVDVHTPMVEFQDAQKKLKADFTMIPDSVHPNDAGHLLMMREMIKPLAEPMEPLGEVDGVTGTTSGNLKAEKDGEGWTIFAPATPSFWVDDGPRELASTMGVDQFVWPKLVVSHLPAGRYLVDVEGGTPVAATADELAAGVNIPLDNEHGKAVHDLTRVKEDAYFNAWRNLRVPLGEKAGVQQAYDVAMTYDERLVDAIREAARADSGVTIHVATIATGENFALKKPYEASDPNVYGWGIGGLTDGSWEANGRHAFATGDKDTFPKTVTVDLQESKTLGQVVVGVPEFGSTKTVVVSVSEDGKTYKDVGQKVFDQRKSSREKFTFDATPARFVRLTYPDHYTDEVGYNKNFAFTTEVEAYGPAKK